MFYLIDKPLGCTSFEVLKRCRKILGIKKLGHTGTLDPLATGCLLIATENSTKLIPLLEGAKKRYRVTIRIDGSTDTLDLGSEVHTLKNYTESLRENISPLSLRDFLLSQTSQIPPKYSALLIGGKRAYDLARDGKDFILSRRSIEIYEVIVHNIDLPNIDIEVLVSSGTYIRSLAPIIGEYFGTNVGYVTSLDRIEIVTLSDIRLRKEQAQSLENFDHLTSLSSDFLFPSIGKIHLSLEEYRNIQNGVTISSPHIQNEGSYFLYYNEVLCSLVDSKNGKLIIRRNNL